MRNLFLTLICLTVAGCAGDRSFTPTVPEAVEVGTPVRVFVATNRARDDRGMWSGDRSTGIDLLKTTVSVPPDHEPGTLNFGYDNPDPETEFTMADRDLYVGPAQFSAELRERLLRHPPNEREVTLFVHGYNATQAETVFRVAQIRYDLQLRGETVAFSWPSRGKPLSYGYDQDSMTLSRDALEQTLHYIEDAQPERILVVAHSMGSALVMEVLRQIDIARPGWPAQTLGGVVLMSPDMDVDVFRSVMTRLDGVPQPFMIMSSERDKALRVSSRLRGQEPADRLGSLSDLSRIEDLPVTLIDTTAYSKEAASSHLVAVTSPGMINILLAAQQLVRVFGDDPELIPYLLGADVSQGSDGRVVQFDPPPE